MDTKKRKPGSGAAPEVEGADFDARLARLEKIVLEMEAGGLGLEQAIQSFQEGVGLLKGCREVLAGYRRQVEELTRGAEETLRPYAADPDADSKD